MYISDYPDMIISNHNSQNHHKFFPSFFPEIQICSKNQLISQGIQKLLEFFEKLSKYKFFIKIGDIGLFTPS